MNTKRVRFNIFLGLNKKPSREVFRFIGRKLSEITGGCTINEDVGFWREDANKFKSRYVGNVEINYTVEIMVMDVISKRAILYEVIKKTIAEADRKFKLRLHIIHVEEFMTSAKHFVVKK